MEPPVQEVPWVGPHLQSRPTPEIPPHCACPASSFLGSRLQSPSTEIRRGRRFPSFLPQPPADSKWSWCLHQDGPANPHQGRREEGRHLCEGRISGFLHSTPFLPINASVLPAGGEMALECCLAARHSPTQTRNPTLGPTSGRGDPSGAKHVVWNQSSALLLAGGKWGKTRLGMAEKFGGWF